MMIEAMVRWTEMRIKQSDADESQLKRLIEGQEGPEYTPEFYHTFAPMTFNITEKLKFNRGQDGKTTVVRFADGDVIVVDMPYEDFRDLYMKFTGNVIHSIIPPGKPKAAAKLLNPTQDPDNDDFKF